MTTNTGRNKRQIALRALLSLLITAPYMLAAGIATDLGTPTMRVLYLLCGLMWLLLPALFLKARAFFVFHSFTLLLGLVECVHLILYHATTSLLFINTIFIAEPGEFLELCSTGWPVIVLAVAFFWGYFWLVFKKMENTPPLNRNQRLAVAMCELLFGLFVAGSLRSAYDGDRRFFFPIHNEKPHAGIYTRVLPFNLLRHTSEIVGLHRQIDAATEQLGHFSFGIQPDEKQPRQTIVLVIGETARYGNFGINGYSRNTTPNLQKRANLVSFDSVYAVANLTTVSVPLMLSPATPQTAAGYMRQKSVVEAFAEGRYQTAWIADQSFGNQILMRISETCDYTHYMPSGNDNFDIRLLDCLRTFTDSAQRAQFVVLHSLGCHYKYNCRYPQETAQFLPDLNSRPDIEELAMNIKEVAKRRDGKPLFDEIRNILVNSYDNAIRYTDYFLDSAISLLEQSGNPCLLLYIGDHGENLLDDDRHLFLHGTYSGSVYEYHVPMFVWYSDGYEKMNPQKVANLRKHKGCKTSSMSLFGTLLDLGGIHYPDLNRTQSLAADEFTPDDTVYGLDANMRLIAIPTQNP